MSQNDLRVADQGDFSATRFSSTRFSLLAAVQGGDAGNPDSELAEFMHDAGDDLRRAHAHGKMTQNCGRPAGHIGHLSNMSGSQGC
jgi:hypothetical protein